MKRILCAAALIVGSVVWGGVTGSPPAAAATVIDLTPDVDGDVLDFKVSPDGEWLVYVVDLGVDEQLFSQPASGGAAIRLDADTGFNSGFDRIEVTPDGGSVVFLADDQVDFRRELFLVPIDGSSERIRLNGPLGPSLTVDVRDDFVVVGGESPRLVYAADTEIDEHESLFSVSLGGGTVVSLFAAPVPGVGVHNFRVAPDGQTVVMRANTLEADYPELFSVAIDSPGLTLMSPPRFVGSDGAVHNFDITADSSRVVFTFDREATDLFQVFSVPLGGDEDDVTMISPPLAPGESLSAPSFRLSPDGEWVAFTVTDIDAASDDYWAFSVPIEGGVVTPLFAGAAADSSSSATDINPTSGRIAMYADVDPGAGTLYAIVEVDATGGGLVLLSESYDSATHGLYPASNPPYSYSQDGNRLLYALVGVDSFALVSAESGESDSVTLSSPSQAGNLAFTVFSNDSRHLAFGYDVDGGFSVDELWRVPAHGGKRELLPTGDDIRAVTWAPDSDRLFWLAEIDGEHHLFATAVGLSPGPGGGGPLSPGGPLPVPAGVEGSVYVPVDPLRLFDTRLGTDAPGPKGVVPAGGSIDVQVTGVGGVPDDAVAVVMNATATEALAAGFTTFHAAGSAKPLASSLNVTAAGQNRPNLVVVPIGDDGRITAFSQSGGHLLGDVMGYFDEVTTGVSAGRIMPLDPTRVLETRVGEPGPGPKGFVGAGQTIDVQIAGVGGVPDDAVAVVVNLTATEGNTGYVSMWASGQPQPFVSTLNTNQPGETTPNLAIAPIGADGKISLFSQAGTHLVADVTGYVTGDSAPVDSSGVFVVVDPTRMFDTRPGEPGPGPKGFVAPAASVTTQFTGVGGVPDDFGLVLFNLTGDQAATGFVTSNADDIPRPLASSLNFNGPNDTRPNAVAIPPGDSGAITHYSQSGAHLLADISGYTLP